MVEIGDADGGTLEDGSLGGFLVGGWKSLLEAVITFPELITATLLRLDALLADILTTAFGLAVGVGEGSKVVILFEITDIILILGLPH